MKPTILVIVGITGDLSRRKLLPAIYEIAKAGKLPPQFQIVGTSRQQLSKTAVLGELKGPRKVKQRKFLSQCLEMAKVDLDDVDDYRALATKLKQLEAKFGAPAQRLFYLAIPPQVLQTIIELIGRSGLANAGAKLLLEKPFGVDYQSAKSLVEHIQKFFKEEQVYRIDHYLAKEMAQNLIVFRSANSLFRQTWSKDFVESIEIAATEDIGIEGRVNFYEQTGALRDVIQSHLLQLAALTLMDVDGADVPGQRLKALNSLQLSDRRQSPLYCQRGQYSTYRQEVGNPKSTTETFVSIKLASNLNAWSNVPITLTAGKALDSKQTSITLHYKKLRSHEANRLVLKIQPKEGVEIDLWAKKPGYEKSLEQVPLKFAYHDHFKDLPDAYEHVLLDAINADHRLFTTSQEVLASWKLLEPIQQQWSMNTKDMVTYKAGSSIAEVLKKTE